MALIKKIELENGVIVNYHRIATINKITNNITILEISSYINEEKRIEEINLIKKGQENGEAISTNIYINTTYIEKKYVENETIKELYNYLKNTEKFKDAEDA